MSSGKTPQDEEDQQRACRQRSRAEAADLRGSKGQMVEGHGTLTGPLGHYGLSVSSPGTAGKQSLLSGIDGFRSRLFGRIDRQGQVKRFGGDEVR